MQVTSFEPDKRKRGRQEPFYEQMGHWLGELEVRIEARLARSIPTCANSPESQHKHQQSALLHQAPACRALTCKGSYALAVPLIFDAFLLTKTGGPLLRPGCNDLQ